MPIYRRLTFFVLCILLLSLACALLEEPARPVIPTPPPTAPPINLQSEPPQTPVTDPVSAVVPAVDPALNDLMNAVSRQQLVAYVQTLEGFGTRNTFSETQRDDFGIGAARRWIRDEFERVGGGRLEVRFEDFTVNIAGRTSNQRNVIATLPGSGEYQGVVVLMAHYDSRTYDPMDGIGRAPGATDNASGVAVMLEVARLMSSRSWNQTVVFVALAAEEQGTFGSRYFVQNMMLEGRIIDAAINNDIVGGRPGIPHYIRLFAPDPDSSPPRQLARYMDLIGGLYLPAFRIDIQPTLDREGRYGDHREFVNAGLAAVRLTESVEDFSVQHTGQDTSDRLDYDYLTTVAQLNLVTLTNLAGAPARPPSPSVAPMAQPGSFILTWPRDPQAAGYLIAFRPVGQDSYEPFRYVSALQAGNIALTGFDSQTRYAISLAALDSAGRVSYFSPEVIVEPQQ